MRAPTLFKFLASASKYLRYEFRIILFGAQSEDHRHALEARTPPASRAEAIDLGRIFFVLLCDNALQKRERRFRSLIGCHLPQLSPILNVTYPRLYNELDIVLSSPDSLSFNTFLRRSRYSRASAPNQAAYGLRTRRTSL